MDTTEIQPQESPRLTAEHTGPIELTPGTIVSVKLHAPGAPQEPPTYSPLPPGTPNPADE